MKRLLIVIPITTLLLTSCFKNKYKKDPTAKDIATIESYFDDLKSISDDASDGSMEVYKSATKDNCATITIDTNGNSTAIEVDYGTTNCNCLDGKDRRGKVVITYNGNYRDSGTVISITPVNYFVNEHELSGSHIVTNEGTNSSGNTWYTIDVDGTMTTPDGETVTYVSDRIREWVEGESTIWNIFDDVYEITGTATGTNSEGTGYTMEVLTPLNVKIGCGYVRSGTHHTSAHEGDSDAGREFAGEAVDTDHST